MKKQILIIGDTLAIALLILIGFASHQEMNKSFLPRMGAAFFPVVISWFVIAPWFGLFQEDHLLKMPSHRRIALAAFYASTMAAFLRGLILQSDIPPVFILALGGSAALGMNVWRWLYALLIRKKQ
jgi:hypothetical protein